MKNRSLTGMLVVFMGILVISACSGKKGYNSILEEELASGKRYDSIFLDINLGMGRKEFFAHCWKLNKSGAVINGPSNLSVEYKVLQEMKDDAYMRFYPKFENDKIFKMEFEFGYYSWAPWNKELAADTLLIDVKKTLFNWYGKRDFILLENDKKTQKVWVKIDGNRRIRLWKEDLRKVKGDIVDLTKINLEQK